MEAFVAAKLLVAVALVNVAFVPVKVVIVAEADVKSAIVALEMVVVANVEVPLILSVPFASRFPVGSAKKLRFSVQAEPFQ